MVLTQIQLRVLVFSLIICAVAFQPPVTAVRIVAPGARF